MEFLDSGLMSFVRKGCELRSREKVYFLSGRDSFLSKPFLTGLDVYANFNGNFG